MNSEMCSIGLFSCCISGSIPCILGEKLRPEGISRPLSGHGSTFDDVVSLGLSCVRFERPADRVAGTLLTKSVGVMSDYTSTGCLMHLKEFGGECACFEFCFAKISSLCTRLAKIFLEILFGAHQQMARNSHGLEVGSRCTPYLTLGDYA